MEAFLTQPQEIWLTHSHNCPILVYVELIRRNNRTFGNYDRNVLIPIILQEPPVEQMTAVIRHIMTMDICLYWPRHQRNEKMFWKSLTAALKTRTRGTELEAGDRVEV